jgi:hypothetical protein
MNPRLGVCIAATSAAAIIGALAGCNYGSTSTSPTPTPIPTSGPDTLYVQDASSKTVRVYLHAAVLNGVAFASATLPTSDPSNPDLIFSPLFNVLWYPSAYPNQTIGPPMSTPIKIWNAPSTKNGANPDVQVPYSNGQGTATYDATHDLLYVANVNGPTLQVYKNAHVMTAASVPAANITITITDAGVAGTPRAQELLYDPVKDRLFVSDMGTVVASFDNFGAAAQTAVTSSTNPTIPASREILGLNSPDGMAYSAANDILFVGEISRKQINVIHNASTANGPNGHGQLITNFSTGPTGIAFDAVRDLLFVYDPLVIWVIPAPEVASGNVNLVVNRRQFFDSASELVGFGLAVDTTK